MLQASSPWILAYQTSINNTATRHSLTLIADASALLTWKIFNMSDNKKQEKDYTPEVDALIPEADKLAKVRLQNIHMHKITNRTS